MEYLQQGLERFKQEHGSEGPAPRRSAGHSHPVAAAYCLHLDEDG